MVTDPPVAPLPTFRLKSPDLLLSDAPTEMLMSPLGAEPLGPVLKVAEPDEPYETLVVRDRSPEAPVPLDPVEMLTSPPTPEPLVPPDTMTFPPAPELELPGEKINDPEFPMALEPVARVTLPLSDGDAPVDIVISPLLPP